MSKRHRRPVLADHAVPLLRLAAMAAAATPTLASFVAVVLAASVRLTVVVPSLARPPALRFGLVSSE